MQSTRFATSARALSAAAVCLAAMLALSGCDSSTSLLSPSDRDELYTLEIRYNGTQLEPGTLLPAKALLAPVIESARGVAAPAELAVDLVGADGRSVQVSAYRTSSEAAASTAPTLRIVDAVDGELPPRALGADVKPGAYVLRVRAVDKAGAELALREIPVFMVQKFPSEPSVSVYPASVRPGGTSLLVARAEREGFDPWVRWKAGRVTLAEGRLSAGNDRVLWKAPTEPGAVTLSFEWYPYPPPLGFPTVPSVSVSRSSLIVPAIGDAAQDEFEMDEGFVARFRLEGDLAEARDASISADPFGAPMLDAWAGGIGYRLSDASGFTARIPPIQAPPNAFSLVLRLSLDKDAKGAVAALRSTDRSLAIVADSGRLYVEGVSPKGTVRTLGPPMPTRPATISVSFRAAGSMTAVAWFVDGRRSASGLADIEPGHWPVSPELVLGGVGGASGFYDELGLWSDGTIEGAYPAFARRLAALRGSSVLLAEGFESLRLPAGFSPKGSTSVGDAGLSLGPNAVVGIDREFDASIGLRVLTEGDARLGILAQDGSLVATLSADGALRVEGRALRTLDASEGILLFVESGRLYASSKSAARVDIAAVSGESLRFDLRAESQGALARSLAILADRRDAPGP